MNRNFTKPGAPTPGVPLTPEEKTILASMLAAHLDDAFEYYTTCAGSEEVADLNRDYINQQVALATKLTGYEFCWDWKALDGDNDEA